MRSGFSAWLFTHYSLSFIFFLLLIDYAALFVMVEAGCRTTCGKLKHIYYPFRVRDDSKHCGKADYELVCEGGEAVLYNGAHKYLVTHIEYPNYMSNYFGNMTIHVDCPFTTSTCRLPLSYYSNFIHNSRNTRLNYSWASFMNCSQKIENDRQFYYKWFSDTSISKLLPVPSRSVGNTTDYVVVGANEIFYFHKSCKLLDTFLFTDDYGDVNSSRQVIGLLQKGFNLRWTDYFLNTNTRCWTQAFRLANGEIERQYYKAVAYHYYFVLNFFYCFCFKACHLVHRVGDENKCHVVIKLIASITSHLLEAFLKYREIFRFLLGPIVIYIFLVNNCCKNTRRLDSIELFLRKQVLVPRRFSYAEIIIMSKHFKEKLGKGGFGQVYKGELLGGHPVAIKMLEGLQFNGDDFISEVSTIGMIHHVNIVQLLGYCSEGTKRALIYEYMTNGSLDKYIFSSQDTSTSSSLSLDKLNSIALGIAKGIDYLHTGCDMQILHFDIKPQNILLDDNFNPKISDFGLAKLYPKGQNLVSISAARGTIGYIAPELISRSFGVISQKSDVYSFGMLILEMAGKRRNFDTRGQNSKEEYYPSWVYDQLIKSEEPDIIEITEIGEFEKRLCKVGLWCIQMNSSHRPTMSEVVKLLESDVDDIQMPPKPFFLSADATIEAEISVHSSSSTLPVVAEHEDLYVDDLV